ncbi:MAG TPA: ATP-binding protein [Steroidobacteraceae bacterium]|jgi:two-component system OmpR family sensor kinase/two-component system sensor histidine kinase QseC
MRSIRTRLLLALLALVAAVSVLAGVLTYRRVLAETSDLLDYQLRQMALSLENQIPLAPRRLPESGADYIIEIWNLFGVIEYASRGVQGTPTIIRPLIGYADLQLQGRRWRAYGLQTVDGIIDVAQPVGVRNALARAAALRVLLPMVALLLLLALAVAAVVGGSLAPLRRLALEVQRRDVHSLTPLAAGRLPEELSPLVEQLNGLLRRLDEAFAAQRSFIADAAHELRSPLTALRLQLQLLERAPDASARDQALSALGAAVERAVHLVSQLLTLARNEPQDARARELVPLLITEPAAEAVAETHALAVSRAVELSLDSPAAERVWVRGDREALRILVRNLVDNAVRYSPRGGRVEVRIGVEGAAAGGRALLQVDDTGPGIPAAEREHAFDRFHRRASAAEEGCGLGLAIVQVIAERHAASVSLEDAPQGGLRVTVRFPPV